MIKSPMKLATLAALLTMPLALSPPQSAIAAGGGGGGGAGGGDPYGSHYETTTPSSPAQQQQGRKAAPRTKKPAKEQSSSVFDDPTFREAYRSAYATIYEHNDYASAIDQLHALGHDEHPNVANLIGYSYRKLGDYKQSQVWYERALKADPNHVLTWNYYGLWQIEQGNRDQAEYHLSRIAAICGTDCEEYRTLAAALEKPPGSTLVY